jgi:hypothetical protein
MRPVLKRRGLARREDRQGSYKETDIGHVQSVSRNRAFRSRGNPQIGAAQNFGIRALNFFGAATEFRCLQLFCNFK